MTSPAVVPPLTTVAPTGFDKVSHLRYRLHLPTLLGVPVLAVYDFLHSCVWREAAYGPEELLRAVAQGKMCAQVSQRQVAEVFGLTRETVNRYLKRLTSVGWVKSDTSPRSGGVKLYVLGKLPGDTLGGGEESLADVTMRAWYDSANALAQHTYKRNYKHLPVMQQKHLVSALLNTREGVSATYVPVTAEGCDPLGGCERSSAPVRKRRVARKSFPAVAAQNGGVIADVGGVIGGCDRTEGGVIVSAEVCVPAQGCEDRDSLIGAKVIPLYPSKTVENVVGGCDPRFIGGVIVEGHLTSTDRNPEVPEITGFFAAERPTFSETIDSTKRISFDSLRSLRTSYSDSFQESQSGALAALHRPEGQRDGDADALHKNPHPSSAAPLSPLGGGVTEALSWVTTLPATASSCEAPLEAAPMPAERFSLSQTPTDPDEGEITPPRAAGGGSQTTHVDLAALVETAKAQSRAALEAKVQKQRAKEKKVANLTSDRGYKAQKVAAQRLEQVWREEMATAFPDLPQIAWFKYERGKLLARKEGKLAADLIDGYGGDVEVCADIVQTFLRYWSEFGPMLTKQTDAIPTFGLLYACHATVVAEGVRLKKKTDAITQYEDWKRKHASNDFAIAPTELEAAYRAATAKKVKK